MPEKASQIRFSVQARVVFAHVCKFDIWSKKKT